jgi:hypothetical protein
LALDQRLWSVQALTAVHDTLAAWQGLGSALATLYTQITTLTPMVGTVTIVGYLASISILHVTLPAIISVEIFQSSQLVNVTTLGNPEFNHSNISCVSVMNSEVFVLRTSAVGVYHIWCNFL